MEKQSRRTKKPIPKEGKVERKPDNSDLMFHALTDWVSIHDENFRVIRANEALAHALGMKAEELEGKKCYEIVQGAEEPWSRCPHRQSLKGGKPKTEEFWEPRLQKYLQVSASPFWNGKSTPIGTIHIVKDLTERKRQEERLFISEQTLRRTFDQAPLGAAIMSLDNRYLRVNAELCRITGYSERELLSLNYPQITHPDDLQRNLELTRDLVAGKFESYQMDKRYIRKDGQIIWVRLFARIVKDASGKPIHFFPMVEDITERKQAEEALRRSEESARRLAKENAVMAEIGRIIGSTLNINEVYEQFAESVRKLVPFDNITVTLINFKENSVSITYASGTPMAGRDTGSVFSLTGTATEGVYKTRSSLLIQNAEGMNRIPGLRPAFQAGMRSVMLAPLISGDRVFGALNILSSQPDFYSQADLEMAGKLALQIGGAIANAQLFSERKKAEEALRESEEKYRSLVANAMDAIFIAQDDKIKFPNPKTLALSGYSEQALSQIPFINIVHPDDRETVLERFRRRIAGENFESLQSYRCVNRAGEVAWVQVNSVITLWEGRPATINFLRDITHEKMLETQLLQAQKVEAIGTLAGGIAHDFNNILSAIIGYAELAGIDLPEGSQAKYNLEQSLKASQRAKDLVRQILAFSRQGKQERKVLNLKPLIKEGIKLLRASLPATIEIRQDLADDLGAVKADPTQIHQVLMNLGTNAAHAMSEQGGVLEISLCNVDRDGGPSSFSAGIDPGTYLRLRMRDTGHGMTPEILKRIFDPYFTTKEVGKGTGLGLAVVHGIVKSHGGGIEVSSTPGKGTTFDVYLPRVDALEVPSETDKVEPLLLGRRERVLLVDDEQAIAEIGKQTLEYLGYVVEIRTSSIEALELFRGHPDRFDLVITDTTMPNMTGDKLARELLQIRPGLPVILCTGFSERITEEKARALGIREFVMKPLVMKDLAGAIRRALD